jgi:hypothetical protein
MIKLTFKLFEVDKYSNGSLGQTYYTPVCPRVVIALLSQAVNAILRHRCVVSTSYYKALRA